jgi:hypothetical protein
LAMHIANKISNAHMYQPIQSLSWGFLGLSI